MTNINRYLIGNTTEFTFEEIEPTTIDINGVVFSTFFRYGAGFENQVPAQFKIEFLSESFADLIINFDYNTIFASHIRGDQRTGCRILSPTSGSDTGFDLFEQRAGNHIYRKNVKCNRWYHFFGYVSSLTNETTFFINGVPMVKLPTTSLPPYTPATDTRVRISMTLQNANVSISLSNLYVGITELTFSRNLIENFIDLETGAPIEVPTITGLTPIVYLKGENNNVYFNSVTGNNFTPDRSITTEVYDDYISCFIPGGGIWGYLESGETLNKQFEAIEATNNGGNAVKGVEFGTTPQNIDKIFIFAVPSFFTYREEEPAVGDFIIRHQDLAKSDSHNILGYDSTVIFDRDYTLTDRNYGTDLKTYMVYVDDAGNAYRWINGKESEFEDIGAAAGQASLFLSEFYTKCSASFLAFRPEDDISGEIKWDDPQYMYDKFIDKFTGLKPWGKYGELPLGITPYISVDQSRGLGWMSYTNGSSPCSNEATHPEAKNYGIGISLKYDFEYNTHTKRKYI